MVELADLEKWCWKEKQRSASNKEMFSLSRALGGKQKIGKQDLEQSLRNTLSSPAQQRKEQRRAEKEALNHFNTQAEKALHNIFAKINKGNKKSKEGSKDSSQGTLSERAHAPGSSEKQASNTSLRQMAAAMMSYINEQFPANEKTFCTKKEDSPHKERSAAFRICKKHC